MSDELGRDQAPSGITCQGCKSPFGTEQLHACPYAADVHDDPTETCNCCDDCAQECAWAI